MANSTQFAKTQDTPSVKLSTTELHGRVRIAYADFTAAGAQETISMFKLPDGARIIGGRVNHIALGGSTQLSVGHAEYVNAAGATIAADVDEYINLLTECLRAYSSRLEVPNTFTLQANEGFSIVG